MALNFWDKLIGNVEDAAMYMESYGEGVGSDTRKIITDFINDGESVLDVGCGPGWNYEHFQQFGPKVSRYKGLDYSKMMIEGAKSKYPEAQFMVGDCRKLKEKSKTWDVVILQDVLEHTNGYRKPVKEALRVAKKRVIITFWKPFRDDGTGDQINEDGDDGWGANYTRGPWEKFLNDTGYFWTETETPEGANRHHYYFIIDKEETKTW